jgi:hypothetical protein
MKKRRSSKNLYRSLPQKAWNGKSVTFLNSRDKFLLLGKSINRTD